MHPHRRQLRERQGAHVRASFTLVAPLTAIAVTDTRITDTSERSGPQLDLFALAASSAVVPLIGRPYADLRWVDVDSANDLCTPATPSTPTSRTSETATRTTITRTTGIWRARSAAGTDEGVSFSQLLAADVDCRRNKRGTASAKAWEARREANLYDLHREINDGSYTPGPSICFAITKPKKREVFAAQYRDRIVHHLVYREIGQRFERAFVADSCACIKGRGTLYAARRFESMVRSITRNWKRPAFYLKCDLRSFFPSISKPRLAARLERRIPDPFWLDLTLRIVFNDPRPNVEIRGDRRILAQIPPEKSLFGRPAHLGLAIGNLLSQVGANVYLDPLDQFIKHRLRVRHYIRYVDDFILLSESTRQLREWHAEIEAFLAREVGVELNHRKTVLQPLARGVDFAGHVIKPHRRTMRRRTFNAALHRLARMPEEDVAEAATSYLGMTRQASRSHRDRTRIANAARRRGFSVNHQLTRVYP